MLRHVHAESFGRLSKTLGNGGTQTLAVLLSTAPSLFQPTITGLRSAGLTGEKARIGLEKPLGDDLDSFRTINDAVSAAFPEERIFRIDHYLGKETVQNLLALRFGNRLFEPLWNASGIEHIQITVSESVGLEGRGGFYDNAGALRDMQACKPRGKPSASNWGALCPAPQPLPSLAPSLAKC